MLFIKLCVKIIQDFKKKVIFVDVVGVDEEKEEFKEVIDFFKNLRKYIEFGVRILKGILFVGLFGIGKIFLVKVVVGEVGVLFFSILGFDFVEMFVGVGVVRVRDFFD